jgi:hypothetical protein
MAWSNVASRAPRAGGRQELLALALLFLQPGFLGQGRLLAGLLRLALPARGHFGGNVLLW